MHEVIYILDFGSQYSQLIARKVRELNVYCEIHPYNRVPEPDQTVKGFILSGSPSSVRDHNAPVPDLSGIKGKVPLLGICYGAQYIAHFHGGEVAPSASREYGRANLRFIDQNSPLLRNISLGSQVWMSHGDTIVRLPDGYRIIASTGDVRIGAFQAPDEPTFGLQFHPEVYHTTEGIKILYNFLVNVCGCSQSWTPGSFIDTKINELRTVIGTEKVVLGLSGGVDSSVAAMLLNRAVGNQLYCIFVNNGLLRKYELKQVRETYERAGLKLIMIDAASRFLDDLKGVIDPENKRKIIGKDFIDVFEAEARKLTDVKWLAQGTIYPDVIESVSVKGPAAKIKSHHNVGGLPEKMNLKIIEPLRLLFKDEVRNIGRALGLD